MINAEKYKEELKEIGEYFAVSKNGKLSHCSVHLCDKCIFCNGEDCRTNEFNWLFEEHKERIKLTMFEYGFLKNLDNEWKYIVKDNCGILYLYTQKPIKKIRYWTTSCFGLGLRVGIFKTNIFEFIKWEDEEPYNIQDVLDNCEVIDDD